jgi:hypothetical protein
MLRNRKDYPTYITPKAQVVWASIDEPDYDYKDGGEFHIKVRFDPADDSWDELRNAAEALLDEAFEQTAAQLQKEKKGALLKKLHKKDSIFAEELTRDENAEPTGMTLLRAGMKYRVEVKNGPNAGKTYEFTPDVFDARGKRIKKVPRVGGGSEVKLSVRPMEYFIAKDGEMGISFGLEAVQIIDLVQGGKRDAESYGFGAEDGFTASDDDGGFSDEGRGFESDEGSDADF